MKLALLTIFLGFTLVDQADARRRGLGIVFIGFGEDISHVADLPQGFIPDEPELDVGLKYNSFRLISATMTRESQELPSAFLSASAIFLR